MPEAAPDQPSVEQQAVEALTYLNDDAKQKVLKYIDSLVQLDEIKPDEQASPE